MAYSTGFDATGETSRAHRVLSLPTTVFIDLRGNMVRRLGNVANEPALKPFIEGQIEAF